jgi:hypothetical protein
MVINHLTVPTKIDEILNLRHLVQLPVATESSVGKSSASASVLPDATAATRPKKKQPKGLRMRFRPSGFGPEDPGMIGFSDSDEPIQSRDKAKFKAPRQLKDQSSKKRKDREDETIHDSNEKTHKKKKKKHKESQADDDTVMENVEANGISKNRKDREHKVSSKTNSLDHEKVNNAEKSRKKDKEKKKKKRDKENA